MEGLKLTKRRRFEGPKEGQKRSKKVQNRGKKGGLEWAVQK